MLDGMSDSIQGSRIENLHSREVDRQSATGLIFYLKFERYHNIDYTSRRDGDACVCFLLLVSRII